MYESVCSALVPYCVLEYASLYDLALGVAVQSDCKGRVWLKQGCRQNETWSRPLFAPLWALHLPCASAFLRLLNWKL
jgi:hypothetical protein